MNGNFSQNSVVTIVEMMMVITMNSWLVCIEAKECEILLSGSNYDSIQAPVSSKH